MSFQTMPVTGAEPPFRIWALCPSGGKHRTLLLLAICISQGGCQQGDKEEIWVQLDLLPEKYQSVHPGELQ